MMGMSCFCPKRQAAAQTVCCCSDTVRRVSAFLPMRQVKSCKASKPSELTLHAIAQNVRQSVSFHHCRGKSNQQISRSSMDAISIIKADEVDGQLTTSGC